MTRLQLRRKVKRVTQRQTTIAIESKVAVAFKKSCKILANMSKQLDSNKVERHFEPVLRLGGHLDTMRNHLMKTDCNTDSNEKSQIELLLGHSGFKF
jgi:hypothetical protein